jgi:hypothetical protein
VNETNMERLNQEGNKKSMQNIGSKNSRKIPLETP